MKSWKPALMYFFQIYKDVFDKYALRKKKYIRGESKSFLAKILAKEIMQRTCLRTMFLKSRTAKHRKSYNK